MTDNDYRLGILIFMAAVAIAFFVGYWKGQRDPERCVICVEVNHE